MKSGYVEALVGPYHEWRGAGQYRRLGPAGLHVEQGILGRPQVEKSVFFWV